MLDKCAVSTVLLLIPLFLHDSQPSIGVVLGFIGFKMILDYFGKAVSFHFIYLFFMRICRLCRTPEILVAGIHVSTEASLGVVATCLSAGVLLSLLKKSE